MLILGHSYRLSGAGKADIYTAASGNQNIKSTATRLSCFGNKFFKSIGVIHVNIPVTDKIFINVAPDIVEAVVPVLLELEVLTQLKALIEFEENTSLSRQDSWYIPLTQKFGHVYIERPILVLYTEQKLKKYTDTSITPSQKNLWLR